jgi:fumarate hydratase class II
MQVIIGAVRAFTERGVRGIAPNRRKAEGWLGRNAIVVTALNPLIGYGAGAALVKEALEREVSIRDLAVEKASRGELKHRDGSRPVRADEIEAALGDLRRLTEGGIVEGGGGGG